MSRKYPCCKICNRLHVEKHLDDTDRCSDCQLSCDEAATYAQTSRNNTLKSIQDLLPIKNAEDFVEAVRSAIKIIEEEV